MLTGKITSFVQTEKGNKAAQMFGMERAATAVEDSVAFLVQTVRPLRDDQVNFVRSCLIIELPQIDNATRENTSGQFPSIEGRNWVW